jgi:LuxR family quorum-sensing system transcriptional regulator CciR
MPRIEVAEQFLEQAQALETKSELFQLLADVSIEIGFQHFALVHHVDLRSPSPHVIHLDNYPASWASYFIQNRLYVDDPIHRACLTSNVGFAWANVPRMIRVTNRQRSILENAAKHGLGDGFTVPANLPGQSSGSCSFATGHGRSLPEENLLVAQLIGGFAFEAARHLNQNGSSLPQNPPRLTPRQLDCLLLAIHGKTDWEISRILDLSEATVGQHLDMARGRYGVNKRLPLAIRAIFDGQISFIEALSWQFPRKKE